MKNRRNVGKMMVALSAAIVVVMASATAFANGSLPDFAPGDYTIEVMHDGVKMDFVNQPFVENGEVYLPLRETLEKVGLLKDIQWENGEMEISVKSTVDAYTTSENSGERSQMSQVELLTVYHCAIGNKNIILKQTKTHFHYALANPPILVGDVTYIPYEFTNYLLAPYDVAFGYTVYDKNNSIIQKLPDILAWNSEAVQE